MSETVLQPIELQTPRLRLRRLRPADAGLIELYASDHRIARMTERIPHPYPPGLAAAFVERVAAGTPEETVWAIDLGADDGNGLIGTIMLRHTEPGGTRIGYWLAPAFWHAGYAGEAVETVVSHARACGLRALDARVFQDNPASVRVLLRAGFAFVGAGEVHSVARSGMVPTFNYHLDLGGETA